MIALVSLEAARSVLGLTAEKVFALVDDGSLLWVFNLGAVKSPKRNLCFWQPALHNPKKFAALDIDEVIAAILPPARNQYRTTEIRLLFCLGRATAWRLVKALGKRTGRGQWYVERSVLANFLHWRWVGGKTV